jgi:hypothetical protein
MEHAFHRKRGKFKPPAAPESGPGTGWEPECYLDVALQSYSQPIPSLAAIPDAA